MFHELLKEAKENVPEPPQPKIKLKLPPTAETPGHHPKKITIHVGGKNSATGSPAPATGQSGDSEATRNEMPANRNLFGGTSSAGTSVNMNQLDKARSMSASVGPPSPSVVGATTSYKYDIPALCAGGDECSRSNPQRHSSAIPAASASTTAP